MPSYSGYSSPDFLNLHQWTWFNVAEDLYLQQHRCERLKSHIANYSSLRPQWLRGLWPLTCWDCGFESHRGHGCVFCDCCVLLGSGLCDELIARPEESYQACCVWVWSWRLDSEEAPVHEGLVCYDAIINHIWLKVICWNKRPLRNILYLFLKSSVLGPNISIASVFLIYLVTVYRRHTHTHTHTHTELTVATYAESDSAALNDVRLHPPRAHNTTVTSRSQNVTATSPPFPNCNLAQTSDMRFWTYELESIPLVTSGCLPPRILSS